MFKKKMHGRVFRTQTSLGWEGEAQVRLDIVDCRDSSRAVHLYMPASDPLANLAEGEEVEIKAC